MDKICLTTRQALTSEPNTRNSEVLQHVAACEACSAFSQKLKQFDAKLKSRPYCQPQTGKIRCLSHRQTTCDRSPAFVGIRHHRSYC